jgi:long-chain acyl-CoA synthetase
MPEDLSRPWVAHYPKDVSATVEVPNVRFPALVEAMVRQFPDRTALIFHNSRTSYRSLWESAGRFAAALARDGFVAGDRLALYLPNCPAHPIAYLGALRLGVTVVQVSPLYIEQDLVHLLADARPKGIVCLEIHHRNLEGVADRVIVPRVYVARLREFFPPLTRPFVNLTLRRSGHSTRMPTGPGIRSFWEATHRPGTFPEPASDDPSHEVAVLQYTGGTTGLPKAAMLSHRNIVANAVQCRAWFRGPPGTSIVLASIPFFHIYGLTVALNFPLIHGGTIVLELRPDPTEILKLVKRYRPIEFPGVPALYAAINHHPDVGRYDLRSIQICLSGSSPLPAEVQRRFEEITGGQLIEGYGLTEASPVTHANPVRGGERRSGTIGLPFPGTDHRIVDLETGTRTLGVGETGELCVRGPQVMLGYYGQPEETEMVLHDGWLQTGDIARIDEDGYATIVDRKKDMVDIGGMKVYPREVEEVLFQHPAIAEAAAIGVPDERLGETIKAFVVLRPGAVATEAEIIEFVRARIAHYKAPRAVEFRTSLPKSGVQKVLRRTLRDESALAGNRPTGRG